MTAARAYSHGKLGLLDGDLAAAERCYRAAAEGFSQIDRPMMAAMSLGMVADFDERAGNYRDATVALEQVAAINDTLGLRGFNGAVLARLGWVLLNDGERERAENAYRRALEAARTLGNRPVVFMALAGLAVLHRLDRREADATAVAVEALEIHRAGNPPRLANRVDTQADVLAAAAACCDVLGCLAADAGHAERAAQLLGHAEHLLGAAGMDRSVLLRGDVDRARDAVREVIGGAALAAASERGRFAEHPADLALRR